MKIAKKQHAQINFTLYNIMWLAFLADKACGESFQKHTKSQNRQSLVHDAIQMSPREQKVISDPNSP